MTPLKTPRSKPLPWKGSRHCSLCPQDKRSQYFLWIRVDQAAKRGMVCTLCACPLKKKLRSPEEKCQKTNGMRYQTLKEHLEIAKIFVKEGILSPFWLRDLRIYEEFGRRYENDPKKCKSCIRGQLAAEHNMSAEGIFQDH